ncbi:MAG: DUF465 domain-containing protein [Thiotrichaceae bacterium]
MFGEHHDIPHEFPEYKELIKHLYHNDSGFKRLYTEYHDLDNEILQIEQNVEAVSDVYAEQLKKKRVYLKDEIYAVLRHQEQTAQA